MLRKSWIKRGKTKLKAKKGLNKLGKQKISVLQRKLWSLCREIVRKRYKNVCYTCGQPNLVGANLQTGHLWAKASLGAYLKYDLRVLRPQCFRCNIHMGGLGAEFYRRMFIIEGQEFMEKLVKDRQITIKAYEHYEKLLLTYQKVLENLSSTLKDK